MREPRGTGGGDRVPGFGKEAPARPVGWLLLLSRAVGELWLLLLACPRTLFTFGATLFSPLPTPSFSCQMGAQEWNAG
jgi:hypothetical protein